MPHRHSLYEIYLIITRLYVEDIRHIEIHQYLDYIVIVTIHSPFGTVIVTCVCPFQMLFEHGQTPFYSGFCMKKHMQKHLERGDCE